MVSASLPVSGLGEVPGRPVVCPLAGSLALEAQAALRRAAEGVGRAQRPRSLGRCAQELVREGLRPDPAFLAASGNGYRQFLVHVDREADLSVEWLVWDPGQSTPIHDHRCWCVAVVAEGAEAETRYSLARHQSQSRLHPLRATIREPGELAVLVPPSDIHQVSNPTDGQAASLHVYGTDISRVGTSIERVYDPVDIA
jgi:predicted metal-dependent enzyme (double-stranded beta helix superfamily)